MRRRRAHGGSNDRVGEPDAKEEQALWRRFKAHGDSSAREALIARYLPLARGEARRHQATGVPFEDMVQVANLGLITAVDRFDPERGVVFTTFAVPVIRGELKTDLDRSGWAVRTPRQLQQLMRRVRRSTEALTSRLGRSPTTDELAADAELSHDEVHEAKRVEMALLSRTEYLGRRASGRRRADVEEGVDEGYASVDEVSTISRAYATLSTQQRQVLHLSVVDELPQHEIADRLGVSQRQVSRILRRATERMQAVVRVSAAEGEA